jgi:hypothetical protein
LRAKPRRKLNPRSLRRPRRRKRNSGGTGALVRPNAASFEPQARGQQREAKS